MTNDPMTMEEFVEAAPGFVAAGAGWLDANRPGWEGRIDLSVLDLRDACRCVLGQVHPTQDYFGVVASTGLMSPSRYGFVVPVLALGAVLHYGADLDYTPLFALLDELWIALVKERHDGSNWVWTTNERHAYHLPGSEPPGPGQSRLPGSQGPGQELRPPCGPQGPCTVYAEVGPVSWPHDRAMEQANLAEQAMHDADEAMSRTTAWSSDISYKRALAERFERRALVHATLAVAYSNLEE